MSFMSSPVWDFLLELMEKVSSLKSEDLGLAFWKDKRSSDLAFSLRALKRASPLPPMESRLGRFL